MGAGHLLIRTKTCLDTYMWVKLEKQVLGYNQDVYFCFCYLPPENTSSYSVYDIDVFDVAPW